MLDSCIRCDDLIDVDGYKPERHGPLLCGPCIKTLATRYAPDDEAASRAAAIHGPTIQALWDQEQKADSMTTRREKEQLVRMALVRSPHWTEQVADVDVLVLASKPIMALDKWTEFELRLAFDWATDGGSVPPRIAEYVRMVRAPVVSEPRAESGGVTLRRLLAEELARDGWGDVSPYLLRHEVNPDERDLDDNDAKALQSVLDRVAARIAEKVRVREDEADRQREAGVRMIADLVEYVESHIDDDPLDATLVGGDPIDARLLRADLVRLWDAFAPGRRALDEDEMPPPPHSCIVCKRPATHEHELAEVALEVDGRETVYAVRHVGCVVDDAARARLVAIGRDVRKARG